MMFIMFLVGAYIAQNSVEAFSLSRFNTQSASVTRFSGFKHLSMSSTEQPQIKVTEIFLTPKVEDEIVVPNYDNETEEERYKRTKLAEIAEKQALEVFVSRQTGKWECQSCGYVYAEDKGNEKYNIKAGTPFDQIEKFRCPQCGANKKYFVAETETLSGFKENLKYGLGGNAMTGGQKGNLIFGALFAGFLIFMSGYLLE